MPAPAKMVPPGSQVEFVTSSRSSAFDLSEVTNYLRGGVDLRSRCQRALVEAEQDVVNLKKALADAQDRVRDCKAALIALPETATLPTDTVNVEPEPETPAPFPPLPMSEDTSAADVVRAIIDANPRRRLTTGEIIEIAAKVYPRKIDVHSVLYKLVNTTKEISAFGDKGHRTYARAKPQNGDSEDA